MIPPDVTVEQVNQLMQGTLCSHVGMECTEVGSDYLVGKMPVDQRTRQPMGLLHGGASVALAETLGSIAANYCVDPATQYCVGLEINANHVRGITDGFVYGRATAVHIGKQTHIWEIRLTNQSGQLVCLSRLTMAVLHRKQ